VYYSPPPLNEIRAKAHSLKYILICTISVFGYLKLNFLRSYTMNIDIQHIHIWIWFNKNIIIHIHFVSEFLVFSFYIKKTHHEHIHFRVKCMGGLKFVSLCHPGPRTHKVCTEVPNHYLSFTAHSKRPRPVTRDDVVCIHILAPSSSFPSWIAITSPSSNRLQPHSHGSATKLFFLSE
jgi:hypothetical protein